MFFPGSLKFRQFTGSFPAYNIISMLFGNGFVRLAAFAVS